jgi:hypothetical protein
VIAILMAGCTSNAPAEADIGSPQDVAGLIHGIVVDKAIKPLGGAIVELQDGTSATVAPDGAFSFPPTAPGVYTLTATRDGYLTSQASGNLAPSGDMDVRFVMLTEDRSEPYFTTTDFDGFAQASAGILTPVVDQTLGSSGITPCDCEFEIYPEAGLSRMVLEVIWDDSISNPTGDSRFVWQVQPTTENASANGDGASPILRVLGRLDFPIQDFQFSNSPAYAVRVYPDTTWPAFSQEYSAFMSMWYRGSPPAGWSLTG